mmetsp:Transcript_2809/g.3849  ORF Transcript_2809/g.3849 Transcript_2809/m.3849 type:complete len:125 (+) Transcript_2809:924-1298(+)
MIGSASMPLHEQQVDLLFEVRRWFEATVTGLHRSLTAPTIVSCWPTTTSCDRSTNSSTRWEWIDWHELVTSIWIVWRHEWFVVSNQVDIPDGLFAPFQFGEAVFFQATKGARNEHPPSKTVWMS